MIFEPTGDLAKDYSAFCEIEERNERDEIIDAIVEGGETKSTRIVMRNLAYCLNRRDILPLCNAIPHCPTLQSLEFTGCGVTEPAMKLITEAVYKSGSVQGLTIDFNPDGLFKDPTNSKKDRKEISVVPSQFRGAHLKVAEPEAKEDPKKKPDPKKAAPAAASPAAAAEDKAPIPIPSGWHSALMTGIQSLSLRGNGIDDAQVASIATLLEGNTDLVSLNLWGNRITSVGVKTLANSLMKNRSLTCLDLGHNQIDDSGVEAIMRCFTVQDVSNDECTRARQRALGLTTLDVPAYPTYNDLVQPLLQPVEEKKDPKKKEPPKKKGAAEGPVERLKGEFDKDCIRLDDHRVRIPGNTSLWCVNLSQNSLLTEQAARSVLQVLHLREPTIEEIYNGGDIKEPSNYVTGLKLAHFFIQHPALDKKHQESINNAIAALTKE